MAEGELNVVNVEVTDEGRANPSYSDESATLEALLRRLVADVYSSSDPIPVFQRIKSSLSQNVPLLPEASRNTGRNVVLWARHGGSLHSLLVASVGAIGLITLTGLLVFVLFFLAATVNAIVISLLMSLAAVGGFLAIFFTCLVAIYIAALTIAAFVISAATISAIVASLIVSGWIGFFLAVWMMAEKSIDFAKHSLAWRSIASRTHGHHD